MNIHSNMIINKTHAPHLNPNTHSNINRTRAPHSNMIINTNINYANRTSLSRLNIDMEQSQSNNNNQVSNNEFALISSRQRTKHSTIISSRQKKKQKLTNKLSYNGRQIVYYQPTKGRSISGLEFDLISVKKQCDQFINNNERKMFLNSSRVASYDQLRDFLTYLKISNPYGKKENLIMALLKYWY